MKSVHPQLREAMECPPERISSRISRAPEPFLHGILMNPGCTRDHVLRILGRKSLPAGVIRRMVESRRWVSHHKIRAAIASHPSTETSIRMELLGFLMWRDLAHLAGNLLVAPRIRRKAERILGLRIGELALGERVALARIATRGVIPALRTEEKPAVVRALLDNSRLTQEDVVTIVSHSPVPEILSGVGEHHLWGRRYAVRLALLRNRRIPIHTALRILPALLRKDLERLARHHQVPRIIRVAARRRLSVQREGRTERKTTGRNDRNPRKCR